MTAGEAKAVFDKAEPFTPEPPRPLRRTLPPPDPFPVEALGDVLGAAAQGIQEKTQAPLAICAQSVLAAATLAVQGYADVQLPTGQTRPGSNVFVTVAASGERKTSADTEALWPIRMHEENLRTRFEADMPSYLNAKDAWTKQRDQILGNKKLYPDWETKHKALDALGPAPPVPLNPMLVCPEPTLEGLERLFVTGQPSMGVFSGEGGQFIGGHGMREETKLRTAASLSGLWDGAPIRRVRAGDGALFLPGRRLALHLMVQLAVAGILLSDPLLNDQGLLSRLLVSAPSTTAGTRLWREPPSHANVVVRRYGARLLSMLETPLPLAANKLNELAPPALRLSPAARRTWIGFHDHVEREIGPGCALEPIRGFANKLPEHAARLAAVLALFADTAASEISPEAVDGGINLAQHYAAEALRVFDVAAARSEIVRAERLLHWLLEVWEEPFVSTPDVYQLGPNAIRDKRTAYDAIAILEEHGWLARVESGGMVRGVRRQEVWRLVFPNNFGKIWGR